MRLTAAFVMLTLTAAVGCSSSSLLSRAPGLAAPMSAVALWKKPKSQPVSKILCLWEAAEGQGLDEKPSRGFAGQIMFFGYGSASPIEAHGEIRIYEYTNFDASADDPQPQHKFRFDDGAWNVHRVDGTLGKTYNVFIPYVHKDKDHAVCALRVEFEDAAGQITSSAFTEVKLASKTSTRPASGLTRNVVSKPSSRVRQASATAPQESKKQPARLESATIRLPLRSR